MALKTDGDDACPQAVPESEVERAGAGERAASATSPAAPRTLEEALQTIRVLRERQSSQASQLLTWRRRAVAHEDALARLSRARQDQLRALSAQLLLFEARLARKQKDIGRVLAQREALLQRQQRDIHLLQTRLAEACLDSSLPLPHADLDSPTGESNLDSLNDSDSAVIMEDGPGSDQEHSVFPRYRGCGDGSVTVARSISDAVEPPSAKWRQAQLAQLHLASISQRSNGFLRRPEVLETVYSVEEDADGDNAGGATGGGTTNTDGSQSRQPGDTNGSGELDCQQSRRTSHSSSIDATPSESSYSGTVRHWGSSPGIAYGSFEQLAQDSAPPGSGQGSPGGHVTTYNRVMSNHRSVTKPKDVKYKRINKAKSKSLEELRGRLRNWVDKGISPNKFTISLDQSYA